MDFMTKLAHLCIALALLSLPALASAQPWSGIISPTRATDWSQAGLPAGLPDVNWTQCGQTITAYDGSADAISKRIQSCAANQFVLLGPGTFHLNTSIDFGRKANVALRGSGANSTFLVFSAAGTVNCNLGNSTLIALCSTDQTDFWSNPPVYKWTDGLGQGSTQLTLSGSAGIVAGSMLFLSQNDDGYSGYNPTTGSSIDNNGYFVCADKYQTDPTTGCWSTLCADVSEVPSNAPAYPNTVPIKGDTAAGQPALPASFYYASKPSWFGSIAWPPIGPDVTNGTVGQCAGKLNTPGQFAGLPATSDAQCTGTSLQAAWGGHVHAIPAMACYFSLGGLPDGTGGLLPFDARACYAGGGVVPLVDPGASPDGGNASFSDGGPLSGDGAMAGDSGGIVPDDAGLRSKGKSGGCSCRVASSAGRTNSGFWLVLILAILGLRRSRALSCLSVAARWGDLFGSGPARPVPRSEITRLACLEESRHLAAPRAERRKPN